VDRLAADIVHTVGIVVDKYHIQDIADSIVGTAFVAAGTIARGWEPVLLLVDRQQHGLELVTDQ